MEETMIYEIGEAILLEVGGVKDIAYPKNIDTPDRLTIVADNGYRYELTIKRV